MSTRLLAAVMILAATPPCFANLGDTIPAAKRRGPTYQQRYAGVDPILDADAKGLVVQECWAAPPQMWPMDVAMRFGTELAGKETTSKPKAQPKDGGEQVFVWPDGTQLIVHAFQEKVIQVEVRRKTYKGNRC